MWGAPREQEEATGILGRLVVGILVGSGEKLTFPHRELTWRCRERGGGGPDGAEKLLSSGTC